MRTLVKHRTLGIYGVLTLLTGVLFALLFTLGRAPLSASAGHSAIDSNLELGNRALQQYQHITSGSSVFGDQYGYAIAIDNIGTTLLVGAPNSNSGLGGVFVYVWNGGNWALQQELAPGDPVENAGFGWSLDIVGNTALIGASGANAAYVFTRSGSVWTQVKKLTGAPANSSFGNSVALDGSGTLTAAVGAYAEDSSTGSVYVFTGSGATWTLQEKILADDSVANNCFGASVALQQDTIVAGTVSKDCSSDSAYVFFRTAGDWSQQAKLIASDTTQDNDFGRSVAIQGNTAIVGAPSQTSDEDPTLIIGGAVYVYTRSGSTWTEQAKVISTDINDTDEFGTAVAISTDTNTILVGAHNHDSERGAVYMFTRSGSVWTQGEKLTIANPVPDASYGLGISVAFGSNAIAAGADLESGFAGAVYYYLESSLIPTPTHTFTPSQTPTHTPTDTLAPTNTPSHTPTASQTPTNTATHTPTNTATNTVTPTNTAIPSNTPTGTLPTTTPSLTPSATTTLTATQTATATDIPGIDVLANGGFETDANADAIPDSWTIKNQTGDKRKCNTDTKFVAFEGSCAFLFKGSIGETSKLEQIIDLTSVSMAAGDTLTLTGAIFPKGTVSTSVKVIVIYTNTALPRGKIMAKFTAAAADYFEFTGTAPLTLADIPTQIKIQLLNKGTSGKVYYDALGLLWQSTGSGVIPLP